MADSKISGLVALAGNELDLDNDLIEVSDVSAGASGSKKMTPRAFGQLPESAALARQWSAFGHVKFDGVTSGQRATAFVPGLNIGRGDFTLTTKCKFPSVWPSDGALFGISPLSTSISTHAFALRTLSTNVLRLLLTGVSTGYAYYDVSVAPYLGGVHDVTVTRTNGVIALFIDKSAITLPALLTAGSSPASSIAETVAGQHVLIGMYSSGAQFNDHIISFYLFNYALTAAQVAELVDFGVTSVNRWASTIGMNAVANQERNALFTATATDWAGYVTGTVAIDVANDELDVTVTNAGDGATLASANLAQVKAGSLYKLSFTVRNFTDVTGIAATFAGQAIGTAAANGEHWFEFTPTAGVGALTFAGTTAGSFSITNIRLEQVVLANGSFETAGGGGADVFAGWVESASGSSTVTAETVSPLSGLKSLKLTIDGSDSLATATQAGALTIGRLYFVRAKVSVDSLTGAPKLQLGNGTGTEGIVTLTSTASTTYSFTFTANTTTFQIKRSTGANRTFLIDDVELIPLGDVVSLSPWGLDKDTPIWRNQAIGNGDAALFGSPIVVTGPGRSYNEENILTQLSRENRALSGGGVYFDGNASQRVSVGLTTAQDIDVTPFWNRVRFTVPAANPAGTRFLTSIGTTSSGSANAYGAYVYISTSGALIVYVHGATVGDYRTALVLDFITRYGGKTVSFAFSRTATGALLVWINGVPHTYSETATGTPPTWLVDIASTYIFAPVTHIGEVFTWQLGRGTLTDALVQELNTIGIRTATGSPISKGGTFSGATDGVVVDLDFSVGAGGVFPDKSGNGFHGYSLVATHTHLIPKQTGQIKGRLTWAGTHEQKEFLASAALMPANAVVTGIVIESTQASSGSGITIGDAATANYWVAAVAFTTAKQALTLAQVFPASGQTRILVDPDTNNFTGSIDITLNYALME